MSSNTESALVALVPEAEALVKPYRDKYDPSAADGMPAHITVLYPFKAPADINANVITALAELFGGFGAFDLILAEAARFPDVLYLAPAPAEPFRQMTQAVAYRFPENPPYGGAFPDVIPHLTVAEVADPEQLTRVASEFENLARDKLPIRARVDEVWLIDNADGRWKRRHAFQLG